MKTKLSKKFASTALALATIMTTLFTFAPMTVHASELVLNEPTGYSYTGVSPHLGYEITHKNIYAMNMDNKKVFCVESGIYTSSGGGYVPEKYIDAKKDILSKIAYYGYTNTKQTHYDYAVAQVMIWEELGDKYTSSTIPDYHKRKAEILKQVNKHDTLPSWNKQKHTVTVGESLTLKDSNSIVSDMTLSSNTTNAKLEQKGNDLVITPNKDSKNGSITYNKIDKSQIGTSIVYRKPEYQTLVEFHLESQKSASVKINVIKLGNVQITKVDEETGRPLPDTTMKFEYNGKTKEVVTDKNGLASLNDIPEGTKVTITEVQAPNGYVNKGISQEVIIKPNETIKVAFDNKEQRGVASLTKTGETPKGVEIIESDYGDMYTFQYNYKPVAGVTYRIEATQDIYSIDGTLKAEKGDVVATVRTDKKGEWKSPELYLGEYQAVEASAPEGYILDPRPIPFSLTYAGQKVELSSVSLSATNEFQSLDLQLFKNEESISSWENNKPVIESIKGDGKVFGVFTRDDYSISDEVPVPKDSLLAFSTVSNGVATFELKLPEGNYYLKELDAGNSHILNDKEYDFTFTAENNHATFPIHIYEEFTATGAETTQKILHTPVVNKLHFNEFSIKKVNEQAIFDKETGVDFNYDLLGTGAVFSLENEDGEIMQEVTIDKEGIGTFKNIPVGVFYLKEKAPSSDSYLLSDSIIRIESTKEGIKAFDEENKLLGESLSDEEEMTTLFEVKNHLKKGTAELTKKDISTGKLLPDTGIRILDSEKNIIAEGRTDSKGIFTFKQLPKGIYYFQEFDAPTGYQLDETPMKFEIKEDGEVVKCEMTNTMIGVKPIPQTGDTTNTAILILGMAVSLSALGALFFRHKKSKTK